MQPLTEVPCHRATKNRYEWSALLLQQFFSGRDTRCHVVVVDWDSLGGMSDPGTVSVCIGPPACQSSVCPEPQRDADGARGSDRRTELLTIDFKTIEHTSDF